MKRSFIYLMILPLLASCSSMEDDYYTNDYRRGPSPTARVDIPNQYHGHNDREVPASANANTHQHDEPSVTIRSTTRHEHRDDNESKVMKQYNDYTAHSHD